MAVIQQILKQYWGYDAFRPLQEDIIQSVLEGRDTLALMPTGGGKSLCFQVPALARDGVCLVISPLIALMSDQVSNLKKLGVRAIALHSGMTYKEIDYALDRCVHGDIKMLYISPERIQSDLFQERAKKMPINLIAVDEAHCISQWGYDFRPAYLNIADLREIHPNVPILALTATATPEVVSDVQEKLMFSSSNVLSKSFARENLAYIVIHEENKRSRLLNICNKVPGTGVVYVRNRKKTEQIAAFLRRKGIAAEAYHAGVGAAIRQERQTAWTSDTTRVMVATNAFGMGIDKPNVRFVVHLDLPEDIESYYQEAGRGGRDGIKSWAIVLYEKSDIMDLEEKVARKFPDPEIIKKTYRALMNHLQVAAGAGENESFRVDIPEIARVFNLKAIDIYNSFKLLENEGYLAFNEAFYSPSRLKIIVKPEVLYDFQLRQPAIGEFIQLILRSYSGLFDNFININEEQLAKRMSSTKRQVEKQLSILKENQIVDYSPMCDAAMVTLTQPAQFNRDLKLSEAVYYQRKKLAFQKMEAVKGYLSDGICRQKRLLHYFGEKNTSDCGICDVCRSERSNVAPKGKMEQHIIDSLKQNSLRPDQLASKLTQYNQEEIIHQLSWMVDEQILYYTPDKSLAVNDARWKKHRRHTT